MAVQRNDSLMLAADLSYRDRKRIGDCEAWVSIQARKRCAKRSCIVAEGEVGRFAGLDFGPFESCLA